MAISILAIDSGNSFTKWGLYTGGRWYIKSRIANHQLSFLVDQWRDCQDIGRVIVSAVSHDSLKKQLNAVISSRFTVPSYWITSTGRQCGVTNCYTKPEQLGSDRWAALIGVWNKYQAASIVVNVGTAITIDALSDEGFFLGGYIFPGPYLLRESLRNNTAIAKLEPVDYEYFPTSTSSAVQNGITLALSAMVEKTLANFYRQEGYPIKYCILSGGGAEARALQPVIDFPIIEADNLVLDGLIVIAKAMTRLD